MTHIIDSVQVEQLMETKSFRVDVTTTAASASPLALVLASTCQHVITGTESQTIVLPDATTLSNGHVFRVWNKSTQDIIIENNSNTQQTLIRPKGKTVITLQDNSSSDGVWAFEDMGETLKTHFPPNNIVHVDKTGDDATGDGTISAPFLTVAAAIASITTSSATNQFLIQIGPGLYNEPLLTLPDFVSMTGSTIGRTILDREPPLPASYDGLINVEGGGTDTLTVVSDTPGIASNKTIYGDGTLTCSQLIGAGYTITAGAATVLQNLDVVNITGGSEGGITHHIVDVGDESEISFLTIQNAGAGYAAITTSREVYFWTAHKVSIYNCDIGIRADATAFDAEVYLEYVDVNGEYSNALKIVAANGFSAFVNIENFYTYPLEGSTNTNPEIIVDGADAEISMLSSAVTGTTLNTGILVTNGAHLNALATNVTDCAIGIHADTNGTSPAIHAGGMTFSGCTLNLSIENTTAVGNYTGYTEYLKKNINQSNTFFITNKDANVVSVAKKGGDFASVKAAIDNITDASTTNRYNVQVGPGVFTEDTIVMKPFVSIRGSGAQVSIIEVDTTTKTVVIASVSSSIYDVTLSKASGVGGLGVYARNNVGEFGEPFLIHNCIFESNETQIEIDGAFGIIAVQANFCRFDPEFVNGIVCTTGSANTAQIYVSNTILFRTGSSVGDFIYLAGTGTKAFFSSVSCTSTTTLGTAIRIRDGAQLVATASSFDGFDKGLHVENVGAAPEVYGNFALLCETYDIQIEHPGTTGSIIGSADKEKVLVNSSSPIAMNYADPDAGQITLKSIYQGDRHDRLLDLSKLIRETSTLGVVSGGLLSEGTGTREIDVSSGNGFLLDSTDLFIKEITWSADTLVIPAGDDRYIFVDTNGNVTSSASPQSLQQVIVLGRVKADTSDIDFIENVPMHQPQHGNELELMLRSSIGPIFGTGALVSESGTRGLAVTAGSYYYGSINLTSTGGSPIDWESYYHSSSVWASSEAVTTIQNTQYDDGSDLISMTASYYRKDSLYLIGDTTTEKYFIVTGQAEYATSEASEAGDIPAPPSWLREAVVLIANITVQEGETNITAITDERPRIGFKPSSLAGSSSHGDLTGLSVDDHPQYLLITGTRAMTGNIDMGSQNVTNVNLVDGVDVSAHAARHLPNGADSLSTAAPVSVGLANTEGVLNTFSRSDHVHRVDNLTHSSLSPRVTETASTLNGTLTLTASSNFEQIITGSATGYSVVLPNATTLTDGWKYEIYNTSSQPITLKDGSGATLGIISQTAVGFGILQYNTTIAGSWIFFQRFYGATDSVVNYSVTASVLFSTTSTSDVVITNFSVTPTEGKYAVWYNGAAFSNRNNILYYCSIYRGGTIIAETERAFLGISSSYQAIQSTMGIINFDGTQACDVRVRAGSGTIEITDRSLILIRLGNQT